MKVYCKYCKHFYQNNFGMEFCKAPGNTGNNYYSDDILKKEAL